MFFLAPLFFTTFFLLICVWQRGAYALWFFVPLEPPDGRVLDDVLILLLIMFSSLFCFCSVQCCISCLLCDQSFMVRMRFPKILSILRRAKMESVRSLFTVTKFLQVALMLPTLVCSVVVVLLIVHCNRNFNILQKWRRLRALHSMWFEWIEI